MVLIGDGAERERLVIPNPRADRELEGNDKLLCFGKLESMRRMIPAKTRRRRRPRIKSLDSEVAT